MFESFEEALINVGETTVFTRRRGSGPPVLMLHGFPETHLMWHAVAPRLADIFTVICADLRGYGASGKPVSTLNHAPYAKTPMAHDMVCMMERLGFSRFGVAGHDRGGRVAYRMALDYPENIERLAVLDIIPTGEAFGRADMRLALGYWPWSLLSQPEPLPERMIISCADAVVDSALQGWGSDQSSFPPDVRAAYIAALQDPATVHAICEEYRAAATLDFTQDIQDRQAHRRIACPILVLWGKGGPLDCWYEEAGGPLGIWRNWADAVSGRATVRGRAIEGGHFFPEHNPAETAAELEVFFRS